FFAGIGYFAGARAWNLCERSSASAGPSRSPYSSEAIGNRCCPRRGTRPYLGDRRLLRGRRRACTEESVLAARSWAFSSASGGACDRYLDAHDSDSAASSVGAPSP